MTAGLTAIRAARARGTTGRATSRMTANALKDQLSARPGSLLRTATASTPTRR
jgi:hypothetical protein